MYRFNMAVYLYLQNVLLVFSVCALYIAGLDVCEDKSNDCQPCNLQYPVPSPTKENCMKTCQVCTDFGNIALNKTANQVSTQFGGVASNAVDGRITGDNTNGNICTHTDQSKPAGTSTHWWCVDLGRMYNLNNVTIYNTVGEYDGRLQGFQLNTASNGQCNQQGFDTSTPCYRDTPDRVIDIYTVDKCNLQSNKSISAGTIFIWHRRFIALTLCEVQAYIGISCSYGYYSTSGSTCEPCDGCSDNKCNPDTGDCIGDCKSGFYGSKCHKNCDGCLYTCTKDTGECIGECKSGFYGNKCDQSCTGCLEKCVKDTGDCIGECKQGLYGTRCNETCSDGCSTSICSKDGSCSCRNGFYGAKCSFECSSNCKNRSCTSSTISSSFPARCTDGCVDGFKGSYCQTPCDVNCRRCDVVSCTVCKPGWYGDNCESRCPTGCTETCNKTSGTCDECKEGTVGLHCNYSCIDECRPIENAGMKSSTCVRGLYGDVCTRKCSQLCRKRECQQETGTCIFGCIGGGKIADCSSDVSEGGKEASISPVGIIGIFVGGLVFGVAVSVIVYICRKRRSYTDQEQTTEENATPLEEQVSNSTESANYYSTTNSHPTHYQNQSYHENKYDSLKHVNDNQNTD